MNNKYFIFVLVLTLTPFVGGQCQQLNNQCDYFYKKLKNIPHEKLTYNKGKHKSLLNRKEQEGCEVKFVTNDSLRADSELPVFMKTIKGTQLYKNGWRMNNKIFAEGPGSSLYGIEKGNKLCLIDYERPTYLKEPGKIVTSSKVVIIVQCQANQ